MSAEARLGLGWPTVLTAITSAVIVLSLAASLYYYSGWIFQSINQRMRIQLIDRLQAQSLVYHASAKTGDTIYRLYQDSAMVTAIIRSIFLEPLMFGFAMWNFGTFSAATSRTSDAVSSLNALISLWGRAQDLAIGLSRVFEIMDLGPGTMHLSDHTLAVNRPARRPDPIHPGWLSTCLRPARGADAGRSLPPVSASRNWRSRGLKRLQPSRKA